MANKVSEWLPLREPTFFILLSLARGEKHGYAIMKDIEDLSRDRVKLSTGTLYEALARLTAGLCRALPGLVPEAPRGPSGAVRSAVFSDADLARHRGVLAHYHVSADKRDPGPAFQWERFLHDVGTLVAAP